MSLSASNAHDTVTPDKRRIMPFEPTATDIRPHIQRLLNAPDAATRRKTAATLLDVNNPMALSALAQAFMNDTSPEVCAAAQHAGKRLYWNALYWELEQNGTIAREVSRRSAAAAQTTQETNSVKPESPHSDDKARIEALLKRGQQKRRGR